jgi:hypothetical protein
MRGRCRNSGVHRRCDGERCDGDERCDGGGASRAATSAATAAGFRERERELVSATSTYTFTHDLGVFNDIMNSVFPPTILPLFPTIFKYLPDLLNFFLDPLKMCKPHVQLP